MPPRFAGLRRITATFGERNYGIYAAGNSVSLIGTWMQRIGVGWLAWELTGSALWLGVVACADLLPTVFVGPIGGAIADRVDRLRIIRIAQSVAAAEAMVLATLTAMGLTTIWVLVLLTTIQGTAVAFSQPARLALIPSLVRRDYLSNAIALNSVIFNMARFIGPALAGLAILTVGVAAAFAVNAVTYLAFLVALRWIRLVEEEAAPSARTVSLVGQVGEGIRYVVAHPGIGPILLLHTAFAVLARPFVELLPGFSDAVFGRGAEGLAVLSSSVGIGAMFAGVWLAGRAGTAGLARLALIHALLATLAILAFAFTDTLWVAVPFVALAGAAMVGSGVATQTLVQTSMDRAMRGRVMSVYGLIFRAGPAVGALLMGAVADIVGLRWPLVAGVLVTLAVWLALWQRRQRIIAGLETP